MAEGVVTSEPFSAQFPEAAEVECAVLCCTARLAQARSQSDDRFEAPSTMRPGCLRNEKMMPLRSRSNSKLHRMIEDISAQYFKQPAKYLKRERQLGFPPIAENESEIKRA